MKTKHKIDYKKELEAASHGMIMIHDPKLLIKLIIRMIVSKVQLQHGGMLLYDDVRDTYVLKITRGPSGIKIPEGFTRFDHDSPVIRLLREKEYRFLTINKNAILVEDLNKMLWQESLMSNGNGLKELLHKFGDQMQMINAAACVPAYYKDKLLAVLLLGSKRDGTPFKQEELDFFAALASDAAMAIRNAQLFEDLKAESRKNHDLFIRATIVLGSTIEAKDKYTHGHTERVTNYATAVARQMVANGTAQFDEAFFENLYLAGIFHDIGKIGIPEAILNKPSKLTDEEFEVIKQHPIHGVEILRPLSELTESLDGVLHHHERHDGAGYPHGLKGDDVPMVASIIAVADTFDAMITDRPYRRANSKKDAIEEIKRCSGMQFNPIPAVAIVQLFDAGKL